MKLEQINIFPDRPGVTLTACIPQGAAGLPAMIVLPGGAYIACAPNEGEPIARFFAERGFAAFVLKYSTMYENFAPARGEPVNKNVHFPGPLLDLGRAVLTIRERAGEWGVSREKIALCGFSAGGHLAASYITGWNGAELAVLGVPPEKLRPSAAVLCYPVTDFGILLSQRAREAAQMVYQALFGTSEPALEQLALRSPARHVTDSTPPTFIWHTADDDRVPVQNSLVMASALERAGVPFELHVFDHGPHAADLSCGLPAEVWPDLAERFLKRIL